MPRPLTVRHRNIGFGRRHELRAVHRIIDVGFIACTDVEVELKNRITAAGVRRVAVERKNIIVKSTVVPARVVVEQAAGLPITSPTADGVVHDRVVGHDRAVAHAV